MRKGLFKERAKATMVPFVVIILIGVFVALFYNNDNRGLPSLSGVAKKVLPAVVRIYSSPENVGSGFVIDQDGFIVTSKHVLRNNWEVVRVLLADGSATNAVVIGTDRASDIALLRAIFVPPMSYVTFGDSTKTQVGDWVFAAGSPFGIETSISVGVVSARARNPRNDMLPFDVIQTDAAINPGNSGGPLFNMRGEVIGVNAVIISPTGITAGVGFAIPSAVAKPVVKELYRYGRVRIRFPGMLTEEREGNVTVTEVYPQKLAAEAGFRTGDIIISFNGNALDGDPRQFEKALHVAPFHTPLPVVVKRGRKTITLTITLKPLSTNTINSTT